MVSAVAASGWRRGRANIMVWLLMALPIAAYSVPTEYAITAPPPWIVPVDPGEPDPAATGQLSNGEYFLLVDNQLRSSPTGLLRYTRLGWSMSAASATAKTRHCCC